MIELSFRYEMLLERNLNEREKKKRNISREIYDMSLLI